MVLGLSRKNCCEKKPADLNSVLTDLSVYILVQTLVSCHGPIPNHSWIRTEFADHQQIHRPTVGQETNDTLRSIGLVQSKDRCHSIKSVVEFIEFRFS